MSKRPYVRVWYHTGKGDDTYSQKPATKKLIAKAVEAEKKGVDVVIALGGRLTLDQKEFLPSTFLKKHPEWAIVKKEPAAKKKTTKRKKTSPWGKMPSLANLKF